MAQQRSRNPSGFDQHSKLVTLLLLALLLCGASPAAARRPRRRNSNNTSNGNNNIDLNNPANPDSASYHSLYNGPGGGNGNANTGNSNAGGNGNGQANGLDGDPNNPRGHSGFVGRARPSRGTTNLNTITYHNGPVMTKPVTAYIIWYGNWPASHPALTIVPEFLSNIGNSAWWNISTTYYDNSAVGGAKVSPTVAFVKSTTVGYTKGTNPSNADIQSVVTTAISSGALPGDVNGVYFVLSSADVNQNSGFCTNYCGWHTNTNMAGVGYIKYSWVGNPARCPANCAAQTTSPNGDTGTDGMTSIMAHELTEAATDPLLNAWYDGNGYENADKCAWKFGTTSTASNGAQYNLVLSSPTGVNSQRQYMVQQNWVNAATGYCAMQ